MAPLNRQQFRYQFDDSEQGHPVVRAFDGERTAGELYVHQYQPGDTDYTVTVRPGYKRQGVASHMVDTMRSHGVDWDMTKSVFFTPEGARFRDAMVARDAKKKADARAAQFDQGSLF